MLGCFSRFALVVAIAGGCVRAPTPLDVSALVKAHGEAGARGELEVRILDNPRDVQARLALAKLADAAGRPGQALEHLEAVLRLGGPLGTRWHDEDRARFARLLKARGEARFARQAATAVADLERARRFGAKVEDAMLAEARGFVAVDELRHADGRTREHGRRVLAELRTAAFAHPSWIGALDGATPRDRGLFGMWLWEKGAKRAAYEALADWRATTSERGAETSAIHAAYVRALAWWTPIDGALPPAADLVGVERCRFVGTGCSAVAIVSEPDAERRDAMLAAITDAPVEPTTDGREAAAWAAITLDQALVHGDQWSARLAQRVRLDALDRSTVPAFARPIFARLAGSSAPGVVDVAALENWQRVLVAAERVLAGASTAQVRAALGDYAAISDGQHVLSVIDPRMIAYSGSPRDAAIARFLGARGVDLGADLPALLAAYARDPAIADRMARDKVATARDAASANAALGTLWVVLGDPARARVAWKAAVDSSPEPAMLRGLADAIARAGDGDAALVYGTAAAAAAGDPAPVWTALARVLEGVGAHHHAIEAARSAMDLAGRESLAAALDVAIAASRSLGRDGQAAGLAARRARLAPPVEGALRAVDDPTDSVAAMAAYTHSATVSAVARMWVASRWNPGDVAIRAALLDAIAGDDPRRALLVAELVELARSPDPERGRAAIAALN